MKTLVCVGFKPFIHLTPFYLDIVPFSMQFYNQFAIKNDGFLLLAFECSSCVNVLLIPMPMTMLSIWIIFGCHCRGFSRYFLFVLWYASNSSLESNERFFHTFTLTPPHLSLYLYFINILHSRRYNESLRYCRSFVVCRISSSYICTSNIK